MSGGIKHWKPLEVRQAVIRDLARNGEIVGKFVETEARRRLLAIKEPKWGEGYRRLVVAKLLTYVVEKEPKAVVITVGVRFGYKGSHHGFWIEVGTRWTKDKPGHAPHPFLRPAVFENQREIVKLLAGE